MEDNTDHNKELDEAIKISLQSFGAKKSQVAPLIEENKQEEGFFTQNDLLKGSQEESRIMEEEKVENPFYEESKESVEELSVEPPASSDPTRDLCQEYMVILQTTIDDDKEFKSVLTILSKLIGNV